MKWQNYIISDPEILLGKPIIKGTRLSIEFILERLADGWTEKMLLDNYSSLTHEAIQAVHSFSLENLREANFIEFK